MKRLITFLPIVIPLVPAVALAVTSAGGSLPWDNPLNVILQDIKGVVAPILVTLGIIIVGFTMMHSEHHMGRTIIGTLIGGSIALGAVALMTGLGWAGATF